jgi:hypothetical protein
MTLIAPRFGNDPTLTACKDGTHRMLAPETGEPVRMVQEALIDLGFPLPPPGADGQFGTDTGNAVVAFKTARSIFPNDPVVGVKTMTALDTECSDKPPAPFTDRAEWLSWRNRAAIPRVGVFDFTRADELARQGAGTSFTFDAVSGWIPATLQSALIQGLTALLDPTGSPAGPGTPPATWGVGPFDLYHCHLVLWTGGVLPVPPLVDGVGAALSNQMTLLRGSVSAPGAAPFDAAWTAAFRTQFLASGLLAKHTTLANDAISVATLAQPLLFVWHSFEHPRWRPAGMTPATPQRNWQSRVAPGTTPPVNFPFTNATMGTVTHHLFQIAFYVSKAGVITAMPGGGLETGSMLGLSGD